MSDSSEEDQETYSGRITKKEQRVYIKIECLRCNTMLIITANLHKACSHDAKGPDRCRIQSLHQSL